MNKKRSDVSNGSVNVVNSNGVLGSNGAFNSGTVSGRDTHLIAEGPM